MGYWDREVDGLVALGIELTEGQLRLLEHGGEGLALRALPDPTHFQCCSSTYLDTNDDLALFLAPITAHAPTDTLPYDGTTVAGVADSWWGEDWYRWPTVLGEIEDVGEGIWGSQELFAVRAWSVEEADEARQYRVSIASRRWLQGTDYEPLASVNHDFASGIDCGDEPCREPCKYRGDDDHDCLAEEDVDNPGFWASMWHLQDAGIVDPNDALRLLRMPSVPPFETALEPDDAAWYLGLKQDSAQAAMNALAGIRRDQRSVYARHEEDYDPWY